MKIAPLWKAASVAPYSNQPLANEPTRLVLLEGCDAQRRLQEAFHELLHRDEFLGLVEYR